MFYITPEGSSRWIQGDETIEYVLKDLTSPFVSLIVRSGQSKTSTTVLSAEEAKRLHLNMLYRITKRDRGGFAVVWPRHASGYIPILFPPGAQYLPSSVLVHTDKLFADQYVARLYREGILVSLPIRF